MPRDSWSGKGEGDEDCIRCNDWLLGEELFTLKLLMELLHYDALKPWHFQGLISRGLRVKYMDDTAILD